MANVKTTMTDIRVIIRECRLQKNRQRRHHRGQLGSHQRNPRLGHCRWKSGQGVKE